MNAEIIIAVVCASIVSFLMLAVSRMRYDRMYPAPADPEPVPAAPRRRIEVQDERRMDVTVFTKRDKHGNVLRRRYKIRLYTIPAGHIINVLRSVTAVGITPNSEEYR